MALKNNPELYVDIKFDTAQAKEQFEKLNVKLISTAKVQEQKLQNVKKKGDVQESVREKSHQNKLRRLAEVNNQKILLAQKTHQSKMLRSQSTWSARMVKGIETMSNAIKGFIIIALATAATQGIKSLLQLGAESEGVRKAFEKLNRADLLDNLREATRNTVSDFELMRIAVKASNFQIPLENLATYLKFAQIRARETGEAVDYLVESIVLGIARKSIPILDNLGISAIQIRDEFGKTGDFAQAVGNIISDSLAAAGETAEITADKIDQLGIKLENIKLGVAAAIVESEAFDATLEAIGTNLENIDWDSMIESLNSMLELVVLIIPPATKVADIFAVWGGWLAKGGILQYSRISGMTSDMEELGESTIGVVEYMYELGRATEQLYEAVPGEDFFELPEFILPTPGRVGIAPTEDIDLLGRLQTQAENVLLPSDAQLSREADLYIEYLNKVLEEAKTKAAQMKAAFLEAYGAITQAVSDIFSLTSAQYNAEAENIQRLMELENERWDTQARQLENAGFANTAYYKKLQREHSETVKKQAAREKELKSKAWDSEKQGNIIGIIMNTAQAVVKALATAPWPIGLGLAGIYAALGGIQLATVEAQQNPYRRQFGGIIPESAGYGDFVPVMAAGGEYVVNREATRDNLDLLELINAGAQPAPTTFSPTIVIQGNVLGNQEFVEKEMLPALERAYHKGYDSPFA